MRGVVYTLIFIGFYWQRKRLKRLAGYLEEKCPVKYFPIVLLVLSGIFLTFSYFLAILHFIVFLGLAYRYWWKKVHSSESVELYSNERKAEFLLSNAVDSEDYQWAVREVKKLGLDPKKIPHRRPSDK